MAAKETRKRKPRNAIRLFIGYEEDAEVLVKKFIEMKKQYEFKNTVDLFSWLIELGEKAGKPSSLNNIHNSQNLSTPDLKSPTGMANKTSRRKQQTPLRANPVNSTLLMDENFYDSDTEEDENEMEREFDGFGENGCVVVQSEEPCLSNGVYSNETSIVKNEEIPIVIPH